MEQFSVFLSSTSHDLREHRDAVATAIGRLDRFRCVRMEDFGARDWEADDFCRRAIGEVDLAIFVIGIFYGNAPEGHDSSFTMREYEAAIDAEVPRLVFLSDSSLEVPARLLQDSHVIANLQKQQSFRERVSHERLLDTFADARELAEKVATAISNWLGSVGSRVEEERDSPETELSLSIRPIPPQPLLAHPYPLPRNFVGREQERRELSAWWNEDMPPIQVIDGMGGMGKSALAWTWLRADVLGLPIGESAPSPRMIGTKPLGVVWWSFYEQASASSFVDAAIEYLQGSCAAEPSEADDQSARLAYLLQTNRVLLVLDGFERQLWDYDPESTGSSDRGRRVRDPQLRRLLLHCAALSNGTRVLITTRLFPADLEDHGGAPLAGCLRRGLEGLGPEDVIRFVRARDIEGTDEQILQVCDTYGRHPLSLRLLVGMLDKDLRGPRHILTAADYDPVPKLKAREHHILDMAYDNLSPTYQNLLSSLATCRTALTRDAIDAVSTLSSERLDEALRELVERGLLMFAQGPRARFDLHPVVRLYAYERLVDPGRVHTAAAEYFRNIAPRDDRAVRSPEQLEPVVELWHHTIKSGQADRASPLLDRLYRQLSYRFRDEQSFLEVLRSLFPNGDFAPPDDIGFSDGRLSSVLASSLDSLGNPRRALEVIQACYARQTDADDEIGRGLVLKALGDQLETIGRTREAEGRFGEASEDLTRAGDRHNDAHALLGLSRVLAIHGRYGEATRVLQAAEEGLRWANYDDPDHSSYVERRRSYIEQKVGHLDAAESSARRALELAGASQREDVHDEQLRLASVLLDKYVGQGAQSDLFEARALVEPAVETCQRLGVVSSSIDSLSSLAELHIAGNELSDALSAASEALRLAEHFEYVLKATRAQAIAAECHEKLGDRASAARLAKLALATASGQGPDYHWVEVIKRVRRLTSEPSPRPGDGEVA